VSAATKELAGLPDFTKWTPAGQERALEELNRSNLDSWKPFYCPRPQCDGNHHVIVHDPAPPVCAVFDDGRPPLLHDWVEAGAWTCQRCHAQGTAEDSWLFRHARADQHPPKGMHWLVWLLLAGRGAGKTRAGSEWVHRLAAKYPKCRIALVSPIAADVRDTQIEGESGLLATARPGEVPEFEPSKKKLTWPNGSTAYGYSSEEPDRLRGKQHHFGWLDEPAHYDNVEDVWSNFVFGLRLGKKDNIDPKICLTTSPLPIDWLKERMAAPGTVVSRASTYANLANLPEHYKSEILAPYEGTRTGRQEILGHILDDVEGALWNHDLLEASRLVSGNPLLDYAPRMDRILVGVDPAGTSTARSDETGILVAGAQDDEQYVLGDYSGKFTPDGWAAEVCRVHDLWKADGVVVEITYGREMVIAVLKGYCDRVGRAMPRIIEVDSRRGKAIRAEPILALWERKQAHIVGILEKLENQLTTWIPGKASPDRLDAMVHVLTELARVSAPASIASPYDLLRRRKTPTSGFGLTGVAYGRTSA
jgi:phage terminase large subunit-like protein